MVLPAVGASIRALDLARVRRPKRHQKAPKGNYCCCRARRNAQFYSAHGHGTIDFVSTVDSCVDLYGRPRALNVVVYTAVASRGAGVQVRPALWDGFNFEPIGL